MWWDWYNGREQSRLNWICGREVLETEKKGLQDEIGTWRKRVNELLDRYKRIDPEEHQKLKEERDKLVADLVRLSKLERYPPLNRSVLRVHSLLICLSFHSYCVVILRCV